MLAWWRCCRCLSFAARHLPRRRSEYPCGRRNSVRPEGGRRRCLKEPGMRNAPACGLDVVRNWGRVQKNARYGQPMTIAGKSYARGLFCHAPSTVKVRLPGPGKTFQAVVGADDALQRDVARLSQRPALAATDLRCESGRKGDLQVEICPRPRRTRTANHRDLAGATEFTLEVSNDPRVEKPNKAARRQTSHPGDKRLGRRRLGRRES